MAPIPTISVRAIQLGESLDTRGFERNDSFSVNPLAFRTAHGGMAMLFKSGAVVFANVTPVEEEALIGSLERRIIAPISPTETETAQIAVAPDEEDLLSGSGIIQLREADQNRLLLIGEALAVSVALAYDERRIAAAFERIEPVSASLLKGRLPYGPKPGLLEQIGEALLIQKRLAGRVDIDEKPDILWDHPGLERLWVKLIDEFDLSARARAIERKLIVIRETADTITDLIATRTSHRLEWLVIFLIAFEIALGIYDRVIK